MFVRRCGTPAGTAWTSRSQSPLSTSTTVSPTLAGIQPISRFGSSRVRRSALRLSPQVRCPWVEGNLVLGESDKPDAECVEFGEDLPVVELAGRTCWRTCRRSPLNVDNSGSGGV